MKALKDFIKRFEATQRKCEIIILIIIIIIIIIIIMTIIIIFILIQLSEMHRAGRLKITNHSLKSQRI